MGSHVPPSRLTLVIDTVGEVLRAELRLADGQLYRRVTARTAGGRDRAVRSLRLIAKVLGPHVRLARVAVATGPATPAGVRLGVALGNAVSFALGVPVSEILKDSGGKIQLGSRLKPGQLRPRYAHPPHLTAPGR